MNHSLNTLFVGDRSLTFPEFKNDILKKTGEEFVFFEVEKLNLAVEDVRRMISFVNKTSEQKKIVLFSSFYWSDEVQNAMLKVLEETPKNTNIFLFSNTKKVFLPTVLSRIQTVQLKNKNRYSKTVDEILKIEPNKRLENKNIKKLLTLKYIDVNFATEKENEKKDRESHILFINSIIKKLLENKESLNLSKHFLKKIVKITTIYDIEGGSPHLFLEWLLLSSPKINA